jgi:hypothetical protein
MDWTDPETGEKHDIYMSEELIQEITQFEGTACKHERKELRHAANAAGLPHIRHQCLACGHLVGPAISKASAPRDLIEADVDKRTRYDAQRKKQRIEIYRKHIAKQTRDNSDFWGRYSKYLNSPEWFTKRAKVLERAGGLCEGCREREATQVHHLSYRHAMDELLFELVAVCDICHDKCHPEPDGPESEVSGDDTIPEDLF